MNAIYLLLGLLLVDQSLATECFEFQFNGVPDRHIEDGDNTRKEIWCYMPLPDPDYETMIFNYDGNNITSNLGLLVGKKVKDGDSKFLFYDQLYGKVRVVEQIGSDFNPYQIPLNSIEVKKAGKGKGFFKKFRPIFSESQKQQIDEMVAHMITSNRKILDFSKSPDISSINRELGNEEIYLPNDKLPPDGYWWPHSGVPMARPNLSPIHLYDLFVKSITGKDPQAREWELKNHSLENVSWGGHCNGWAASSILHGFYEKGLIMNLGDGKGEILINPSDIQGMRTETSFCVKMAFYGTRYRDSKDDLSDIRPDLFHKVLIYYLKHLGKPIALDRYPDESIDNSIFSGYSMVVNKISENKYQVNVSVLTHYYNDHRIYFKANSQRGSNDYSYVLFTDEKGKINGGEWNYSHYHPDFLWVPLVQMKCGRENPKMDHSYIDKMINTLPKGTFHMETLNQTLSIKLAPGEAKRIPLNLEKEFIGSIEMNTDGTGGTIKFIVEDELGKQRETQEKFSNVLNHNICSKKIKEMEVYNYSPKPKNLSVFLSQLNYLTELEK